MNVRDVLKGARAAIVEGGRDLYTAIEQSAGPGPRAVEALELLEQQATPAHAAMNAAIDKWARYPTDANGRAAIEAAGRPGAAIGLFFWLKDPARRRSHVLQIFDRAIERAKNQPQEQP